MVGEVLAGFTLTQEVGSGGTGTVYLAEHPRLEQRAVVKVFDGAAIADPARLELAFADARAAAGLEHPSIVEVLECGEDGGQAFIVTEYVDGQSLALARNAVGRFSDIRYVLVLAGKIANALGAAHRAGIVHGDLKPENILILDAASEDPGVKLLDFGMVRLGARAGACASPEQRRGGSTIGPASDIFSLGCIIYDLACGSPPFGPGETDTGKFPAPSSLVPGLPPAFDEFLQLLLAESPDARPGTMKEVEARCGELRRASSPAVRTAVLSDPRIAPVGGEPAVQPAPVAATQAYQAKPQKRGASNPSPNNRAAMEPPAPKEKAPPREGARELPPTDRAHRAGPQPPPPAAKTSGRWGIAVAALGVVAVVVVALIAGAFWVPEKSAHAPGSPVPAPPEPVSAKTDPQPPPSDMVSLPGGTFTMGSTEAEIQETYERCHATDPSCRRDRFEREGPARSVTLEPFSLDRTEVTNEQFAAWLSRQEVEVDQQQLVRAKGLLLANLHPGYGGVERGASGGFQARAGRGQRPVVQVSWYAADRFCRDVGKRLPTEAEWEYAARGLAGRRYPWGNREPTCTEVDLNRGPSGRCGTAGGPDDVGSASGDVTPDGVHDLGGSVAEWIADTYVAPYPICEGGCRGPLQGGGAQDTGPRVVRGGDWQEPNDTARGASRTRVKPGSVKTNLGFRCARSAR